MKLAKNFATFAGSSLLSDLDISSGTVAALFFGLTHETDEMPSNSAKTCRLCDTIAP